MIEVEFGWARDHQVQRCARLPGADRMLCGRRVGFVPAVPMGRPPDEVLHGRCRELLDAGTVELPPRRGRGCPVCGEPVPVVDGRVSAHGGCPGVNMPVGGR
ncbi:hypothetical protein [Actinoplanes rectilineatus]|uniref:hypothetical protein n=1 Tax=Actinoplanes rectilineatus TaxID=113571 RepID=UPI0005F2BCAD|nr:hypothetical protein [Actinoplanes rectilineatus]